MKPKRKTSFIRYSLFAFILIFSVSVLTLLSFKLADEITKNEKKEHLSNPTDILAFLIGKSSSDTELVKTINEIYESKERGLPFEIRLLTLEGLVLSPKDKEGERFDLSTFPSSYKLEDKRKKRFDLKRRREQGPPRDHFHVKYRLSANRYLVFQPKDLKGKGPDGFILSMGGLILALSLGVVCTIAFMLISFKKRNEAMEEVIEKLKKGDLKARIEVGRFDEYNQTMFSFNKMADQIEELVKSLRKTEGVRKDLMRELAHDLRTPIASLRSSLEIVKDKSDRLSEEKKERLFEISLKEIDYFSSLVEDLLFLGSVDEPRYKESLGEIDMEGLIEAEIQSALERYQDCVVDFKKEGLEVFYGDEKFITRLVRNGLENALSFAESKVFIKTYMSNEEFFIEIEDDGPGFSDEEIKKFGFKKYSRKMSKSKEGRISIGLGSVIMRSVVDAYKGSLSVSNRYNKNEVRSGAKVTIKLLNL